MFTLFSQRATLIQLTGPLLRRLRVSPIIGYKNNCRKVRINSKYFGNNKTVFLAVQDIFLVIVGNIDGLHFTSRTASALNQTAYIIYGYLASSTKKESPGKPTVAKYTN